MNFEEVNRAALACGVGLLQEWFPAGRVNGGEYEIGNVNGDAGKSLKINIAGGAWADFADDVKGGDRISLYAAHMGLSQIEAANALADKLGLALNRTPAVSPSNAALPKFYKRKPVTGCWAYRGLAGEVLGYDVRIDLPGGEKEIVTHRWIDGKWKAKGFLKPRPLYGLFQLAQRPKAPVLICEGCKATDAAVQLLGKYYVCMSWPNGSNSVKHADWTQIKGRAVLIWPDADEPGLKAAYQIAELLSTNAKEIKILAPINKPDGWDAADALADGWDMNKTIAWAKEHATIWNAGNSGESFSLGETSEGLTGRQPSTPSAPADGEQPPIPAPEDYGEAIGVPLDDDMPFRVLGYDDGIYYFLPRGTGQIKGLTAGGMTATGLLSLASLQWWESRSGLGAKELTAQANWLIRSCESAGVFNPKNLRGRGAWLDGKRTVVNLGDQLYVDGVMQASARFDSRFVYPVGLPLEIDMAKPATNAEAHRLIDICECISWRFPLSSKLLAGWMVSAMVCGIFHWRQHLWITGPAQSGKSTIVNEIIGRFLADIAVKVEGGTTEAYLRQTLKFDVLPVLVDEFEVEGKHQAGQAQAVLNFARKASSGATIGKGTTSGAPISFVCRQAFCFSSINKSVKEYADESRITTLHIKRNKHPDAEQQFTDLKLMYLDTLTPKYTASMFSRCVQNLAVLRENEAVFSKAATVVFGERRAGDGLGPILAGAHLCHSTKVATFETAKTFIEGYDWHEHTSIDAEKDKDRLIAHVAARRIRVGNNEISVGEIIECAADPTLSGVMDAVDAAKLLRRYGVRVYPRMSEESEGVCIAERGPFSELVIGTVWANNWKDALRDVVGSETGVGPIYFTPGNKHRATRLPLALFLW